MLSISKSMMKVAALATLAIMLLTSCAPAATTPAATTAPAAPAAPGAAATTAPAAGQASGAKTTLTFWNGFTGPDRAAVEEITKRFSTANPNITVSMDVQPWDTLMQKLLSSLSTGQGPDVLAIHINYLPQYAKSGYVADLSQYVQAGSQLDPSQWPQALVDGMKYNGKFYATPMNYATLMMYYNKDMFKAAGLDPNNPPKTWDEWIADIKKLTKHDASGDQYGISIGEHDTIANWPLFLWGNGGDVVKDGKPDLSNPKSVQALQTWTDLVKNDKVSPTGLSGAEADKLFQTQKAAMEITGPWMTNGFTEAKLNYDVAPIPAGPAGSFTLADSVILLVNKSSKNQAAAVEFLKWWNSKDAQLYLAQQTGFPPTRTDLINDPALKQNPWAAKFASVAPQSKFYLMGLEKYAQIDGDVFVPTIQSIVLGKSTVADATKSADSKIDPLLK